MFAQTGRPVFDAEGMLQKGTVIRHMVMPGGRADSIRILEWIAENFSSDEVLVSLMSQYTPFYRSSEFPEINRRITSLEYDSVLNRMIALGLTNGYMQEKNSAKERG